MARAGGKKHYNAFVRGLITEASALTFPENASKDEVNFELKRNGSRARRLGMNFENQYAFSPEFTSAEQSDFAIVGGEWKSAGQSGANQFAVVQIGTTLYFYDINSSSLSGGLKSFTVDLATFQTSYATNFGSEPCDFASAFGNLFVVSNDTEPFYITYDASTDTITTTQITIKIRDLEGVDDGLEVDEKPSVITVEHEYNLRNQGWSTDIEPDSGSRDTIAKYNSVNTGTYPSNSFVWWESKDANEKYDAAQHDRIQTGNNQAAKGHYILEAFNKKRVNGVDGVADSETPLSSGTIPDEIEKNRPTTVAFFAGRTWYSGVKSNVTAGSYNNTSIYFSPVLQSPKDAGKCYQLGDPTAESGNELLASDGGVVVIPEAGNILKLLTLGNSVLVFADNGVWSISGDVESGFTADSYQVYQISTVGAVSRDSVVGVEGVALYWADGGIYSVQMNEMGRYGTTNLSELTIQDFYKDIPKNNKKNVVGHYDAISKKVSWLYPTADENYDGVSQRWKFDGELWFDTVLQAFYPYTYADVASRTPYVSGYISLTTEVYATSEVDVVDSSGEPVVDSTGDQVFVNRTVAGSESNRTKYICVVPSLNSTKYKVTFGLHRDTTFTDWVSYDGTGVDYTSYLLTGTELFEDPSINKQVPYITCYFLRTEDGFDGTDVDDFDASRPSSCFLQARWDFTNSGNTGKWSKKQQVYRLKRLYQPTNIFDPFDYGYEVIVTTTRLRGGGRALNLYFESESGKDMQLLGWTTNVAAG